MAFLRRNWLARIGIGLNKFIIGDKDGSGKQTLTNSPDSITQEGDVISADNLNDLEDRIAEAFNGFKLTKIWENPNPSASFAAQNVDPDYVGDGREIVIEYYPDSASQDTTMLWLRATGSAGNRYEGFMQYLCVNNVVNTTIIATRYISQSSVVGRLVFDNCYESDAGTISMNNDYLIPVRIYEIIDNEG